MSELARISGWSTASGTSRALVRVDHDLSLAVSRAQARAELEAAKLDGIAAVAGKAMQDVALLSQMESALATAVPHASGRLATIADLAAVSMAGVVADAARRIGG